MKKLLGMVTVVAEYHGEFEQDLNIFQVKDSSPKELLANIAQELINIVGQDIDHASFTSITVGGEFETNYYDYEMDIYPMVEVLLSTTTK